MNQEVRLVETITAGAHRPVLHVLVNAVGTIILQDAADPSMQVRILDGMVPQLVSILAEIAAENGRGNTGATGP